MFKKYLLASLLITINTYAIGVSGHARSPHGSPHQFSVTSHESVSLHYVPRIVPIVDITASQRYSSLNAAKAISVQVKGVLTCKPSRKSVRDEVGYIYDGCTIGSFMNKSNIPIDEFFRRFKPDNASVITMVIYNKDYFEIYYS